MRERERRGGETKILVIYSAERDHRPTLGRYTLDVIKVIDRTDGNPFANLSGTFNYLTEFLRAITF